MGTPITLGDQQYSVTEQPHPRIWRTLPKVVSGLDLDQGNKDAGGLVASLGDKAYDALKVLIPDLMPRWKFQGYASQEAMEAEEEDDGAMDKAPTMAQIIRAFEAAFAENGGERITSLLGKLLGKEISSVVHTFVAQRLIESLDSEPSPSLPSPSDGSPPLTSSTGTNGPTTEAPALVG